MQPGDTLTRYKVLNVASKAFPDNGRIPGKYTCEGQNINPPLDVDDIPPEARSLACVIEDTDIPGKPFVHWLVWNIPISHHIHENEVPGDQGMNDFGFNCYGGPCPPSGTHHYLIKVYALDDLLDLREGSIRGAVEDAMRDHILAYGELRGTYKRPVHKGNK